MTTLALPHAFAADTVLLGSDLDANFAQIKNFINAAEDGNGDGVPDGGIDATNLAATVRLANTQLAEPNAIVATPTLVVVQQTDVAITSKEKSIYFFAPCDMVLVDLAINMYKSDSAAGTAALSLSSNNVAAGAASYGYITYDDSVASNQAWGVSGSSRLIEVKEGSQLRLAVEALSANVEFLTCRAIFKAAHTGR